MLTRRHLLSAAPMAALAATAAGPATAQEASLPPRYGTITLSPGFMPDPFVKRVQAGGGIDLAARFARRTTAGPRQASGRDRTAAPRPT